MAAKKKAYRFKDGRYWCARCGFFTPMENKMKRHVQNKHGRQSNSDGGNEQ